MVVLAARKATQEFGCLKTADEMMRIRTQQPQLRIGSPTWEEFEGTDELILLEWGSVSRQYLVNT